MQNQLTKLEIYNGVFRLDDIAARYVARRKLRR